MAANPIYQYELYFLHSTTGEGWREQLAWQGSGASVFDGGGAWAQARRTFLAADCSIIGTSRRRIDGVKDSESFLFSTPYQGQFGNALSIGSGKVNEPANTVEYEVYTASRANRRCFYFRGIDDAWITSGKLTPFGEGQLDLVEAYLTFVKNGVGALRTQGNTWTSIATVNNATTALGSPLLVSAPNLNPPVTGNLIIYTKGLKNYPYLNGRWVGLYNAPDVVSLGSASGRYTAALTGVGYVRLNNIQVSQINTWFFARCGNRKTGLPFGVLRGRKSKKVLHR